MNDGLVRLKQLAAEGDMYVHPPEVISHAASGHCDPIQRPPMFRAGEKAERERIVAILRAVSSNAGFDGKLLLHELILVIEEKQK